MDSLLILVHRIPYPPNKGDKIRSYHFLKFLKDDFRIFLGTFIDDPADWRHVSAVRAWCADTCCIGNPPLLARIRSVRGFLTGEALSLPYFRNPALRAWVDATLRAQPIRKVLVLSSVMAQYVAPAVQRGEGTPLDLIVDFVDVDSDKWRQYANQKRGPARWVYARESKRLLRYEKRVAGLAKVSLFVSEQEAALFRVLAPAWRERIGHINNGVDTDYFSPDHAGASPYRPDEEVLVFTGAMDYWANVDAVTWFGKSVLPLLQRECPRAKFYIVGSRPSAAVLALAAENIVVTGSVEDVRPYLAHAVLAVAPLRIARGIQNKVLEAMAMGKHVVATSAAMEGIPFAPDHAVSVCDDAASMAGRLAALLSGNRAALSSPANRRFICEAFSWERNVRQLAGLLRS